MGTEKIKALASNKIYYFARIATIFSALVALVATGISSSFFLGSRTITQRDDITRGVDIKNQIMVLRTQITSVEDQLVTIQEKLNSAMKDPNNLARVDLQAEIKRVSVELKSLKDVLGSDVERALSVPLFRKDIQKIEEQFRERTDVASREIDRIYDQNKWFLGLMATMAVSLLGLAISNLLQTRRIKANP